MFSQTIYATPLVGMAGYDRFLSFDKNLIELYTRAQSQQTVQNSHVQQFIRCSKRNHPLWYQLLRSDTSVRVK
jgi:hypothetical protein